MCAPDPNAGRREAARQKNNERINKYYADSIKQWNRETDYKQNVTTIKGIGASRTRSDFDMFALQQQGTGLLAKQEAAKKYYASKSVDEGGRSNRFGKNKMADYLNKIAAVDRQEYALATVGEATAETGRERRQQAMIDKQNQALGGDPQFGMPTMDPGRDAAGQMMNSISFGLNVATGLAAISDKRVKDNIDRVGTSPQGYGIYEWNYRGESPDERYRGVIAQDVVKQNPMAVTILENGLLGVYYDKLDVELEAV